ncbi:MAG: DUF1800 domain-containing protein [Acidobacteriia bacterium]|nr:DUF1800 domain-containing protein [Terriglobia bacterium]
MQRKHLTILLLVLALGISASVWAGNKKKDKKAAAAVQMQMDARQRALHALNRLTFGPRPGDVDRVMAMGLDKWFERQLHPEKIDDAALEARLAPLRTLRMDARQLVENFPPPQLVKQVAEGRRAMPSDKTERAIYQSQVEKYEQRQEKKAAKLETAGTSQEENPHPVVPNPGPTRVGQPQVGDDLQMTLTEEQKAERREARWQAREQAERIMALPTPDQRMQAILAMDPQQRQMLARALPPEERERLMNSLTPQQREQLMAMNNPQQVIATELMQGKILRATYSERQLDEVMTDFWLNHFNVFIGKGADRYLVTDYERDVIRPHALGKFQDLLMATANSPAMLFYLDNWQSVGPRSPVGMGESPRARNYGGFRRNRPFGGPFGRPFPPPQRRPQQQAKGKKQQRGLNENYARELMELHTLGVDGGYSQKDVTELARVFTGWTIREPRRGGDFEFNERMHEPGTKFVLGHTIKEHGEDEGKEMLKLLAHHPSTAHFISKKLAMRFVSDNPPPTLVNRMAETFLKSDGDIRRVLRTMFDAPEFWAPEAFRAKVKTPLEFVVSAVRASGAEVSNAMPLVQTLNQMGMPLYGAQPPTGYSMKAETWVNSSALLNRMNFALRFTSRRMPGVAFAPERVLGSAEAPSDTSTALARLENTLLAGDVSKQTHETILKHAAEPEITGRILDDPARPPNVGALAGLIFGSPEFQKR